MSESADPTFCDDATLIRSVQRDLGEIAKRLSEAAGFAREAQATMFELQRREAAAALRQSPTVEEVARVIVDGTGEVQPLIPASDMEQVTRDLGEAVKLLREVLPCAENYLASGSEASMALKECSFGDITREARAFLAKQDNPNG